MFTRDGKGASRACARWQRLLVTKTHRDAFADLLDHRLAVGTHRLHACTIFVRERVARERLFKRGDLRTDSPRVRRHRARAAGSVRRAARSLGTHCVVAVHDRNACSLLPRLALELTFRALHLR